MSPLLPPWRMDFAQRRSLTPCSCLTLAVGLSTFRWSQLRNVQGVALNTWLIGVIQRAQMTPPPGTGWVPDLPLSPTNDSALARQPGATAWRRDPWIVRSQMP